MMAQGIFSKLVDYIKSGLAFVLRIPNLLKTQFLGIKENLVRLRYNLKNFTETNINLGIYHLNNQNYNDAIFRFRLIDKFLRPNDPFVNYWTGWAYFLKKKYKKAIFYLEKGQSEDKIGLLKFIKEIDHISKVPSEIYSVYRGIITKDIIDKFFNKNLNLPRELIVKLIGAIDSLPENYSILEIGSNIGFVGEEIEKRMQEGFSITGIESSTQMIKLQKQSKRDKVYDKIINSSIENYLTSYPDEKYDIILSLDGFANISELSDLFNTLYNSLSSGGYFAFACRVSNNKGFSDQYLEFVYKEDYIHKLLNKCGFSIIEEPNSEPLIKNSYVIFVCKKLSQVKK